MLQLKKKKLAGVRCVGTIMRTPKQTSALTDGRGPLRNNTAAWVFLEAAPLAGEDEPSAEGTIEEIEGWGSGVARLGIRRIRE